MKTETATAAQKQRKPRNHVERALPIDERIAKDGLLFLHEVCSFLALSENSVRALVKSGELKARRFGATWRITGESVRELIEAIGRQAA
jgi:excisionase family DNA binding protein